MKEKEQHPILQALQDYFDNTPKEQLEKDWEELEKFNQSGPDMLEILDNARERFMANAKIYSSENPDDNAFCLPKDYEQQMEILGQKFDKMLEFDETIDVNSREELIEKANKYIEENFKV